METPKNTTDKKEKGFVHKVKMAAAILLGALAINAATSQNANAQMFKTRPMSEQNAEKKAEGKQLDKTIVKEKEKNAKKEIIKARNEKIIAEMREGKGNKQPISRAKTQQLSGDGK